MVRHRGGRSSKLENRTQLIIRKALLQNPVHNFRERQVEDSTNDDYNLDSESPLPAATGQSSLNFPNLAHVVQESQFETSSADHNDKVKPGTNHLPIRKALFQNSPHRSPERHQDGISDDSSVLAVSLPPAVDSNEEPESVLDVLNNLPLSYQVELDVDVIPAPAENYLSVLSDLVPAFEENSVTVENISDNLDLIRDVEENNNPTISSPAAIAAEERSTEVTGKKKPKVTPQKTRRKRLKEAGKEYLTKEGKQIEARSLKAGCSDKCPRQCNSNFTFEARKILFDKYWELSPLQRKEFILKHVKKDTKTQTTVKGASRRLYSRQYFLPKNGESVQVCRNFFQATLDVTSKFLRCTEKDVSILGTAKNDNRGGTVPKNKTPPRSLQHLRQFIEALPAVDSHYCRNSTNRKYLPESSENLRNIYRHYQDYCSSKKFSAVSEFIFRRTFTKEYNIGIHVPKKDKCSICVRFSSLANPTIEEQEAKMAHDTEKKAINVIYSECQERSKADASFVTASFDLEKVLTTPYGKSVLFYYSRKYAVYNLTFYESYTRNVYCYVWGESDGNRGCVEVCSIMEKYLHEIDSRGIVKEVALFCDNCAGQQKNIAMIAVLTHFLKISTTVKKISLNFLMAGHSMMTVDSVHATIERATQKKTVYAPSEWLTVISNARYEPFPYNVIKLNFLDFRDWKSVGDRLNLTLDGGVKLKISEVRRAIFEKNEVQKMKFRVITNANNPEEKYVNVRQKRGRELKDPCPKYCNPLPISTKKYRDLVDLCCSKHAIPDHYHQEYIRLPHSNTVRDALPEPDTEEEDELLL